MARLKSLQQIERLYAERGGRSYGEGVSQSEHALQCAALAEGEGAAPALVIAALLHDVGHLFFSEADAAAADDRHEALGAEALTDLFGEDVLAPIALHVAAKRWLCFKQPGYAATLSAASTATLAMQGGPFDAVQAAAFEQQPHWRDALALRRWDDWGKREDPSDHRAFCEYLPAMRALVKS
jgi:phosphonate degradation associated HDIG domain protein